MRVTANTKEKTRKRIRDQAFKLFQRKGFAETTTRHIARKAGIATGTLFNYFSTKEALAITIISEALEMATAEFHKRLRGDESLDEALFAHVATGLRHLRPHRGYIGEVLENTLSPFTNSSAPEETHQLRFKHLETVRDLITSYGSAETTEPSLVIMHLYWTFFLGVLAYWATDESLNQEDTLTLLDQSMQLFMNSLSNHPNRNVKESHG